MLSIFIHTSHKNIYLTHTFIIGGFEIHERLYLSKGLTVNSIVIDVVNM